MRYFDPMTNADPPSVSEPPSPFLAGAVNSGSRIVTQSQLMQENITE